MGNDEKLAVISAYNYNFGTVLQATALISVLHRYSSDAEVIKYKKKISLMQIMRIFNKNLLIAKVKVVYKQIRFMCNRKQKIWLYEKNNKFQDFLEKHIVFSKEVIGYDNLKEFIKKYDIVILGSDQLWNPINIGTHYFTLEFVPSEIPKYTYATSFGVSKLSKKEEKIMRQSLKRINRISVREEQGALLVRSLVEDIDIRVDVDPTLLLDRNEWNKVIPIKNLIKKKYIFAYFVGSNAEHRQVLDEFAKKNNYYVVDIPHIDQFVSCERKYENELTMTAGPEEFVNLIRFADYIFTDSFHGCVFSLIYGKTFFPFPRFKENNQYGKNSRLESLFSMLNLSNMWVNSYADLEKNIMRNINYNKMYNIINAYRKESLQYLQSILAYEVKTK